MRPEGVALVTGASRGIGRAVATELARRGFDVVATMRDPKAGADLAGMRVERLDVDDPTSIHLPAGLRVLVNNAATESDYLPVEHIPMTLWRTLFETNVFGLIEVTRRAIPLMRQAGGGVICNITSSSLFAPMPFYAAYRAGKAAVGAIGESLRAELAPFGIRVLEVMPGPIATDMLAASNRLPEAAEHAPYRAMAERVLELRQGVESASTSPADAAVAIVDAICDDDAPLRVGCDAMSVAMLDHWRTVDDESNMAGLLAAFQPD